MNIKILNLNYEDFGKICVTQTHNFDKMLSLNRSYFCDILFKNKKIFKILNFLLDFCFNLW